jgi:hypothetical protein
MDAYKRQRIAEMEQQIAVWIQEEKKGMRVEEKIARIMAILNEFMEFKQEYMRIGGDNVDLDFFGISVTIADSIGAVMRGTVELQDTPPMLWDRENGEVV